MVWPSDASTAVGAIGKVTVRMVPQEQISELQMKPTEILATLDQGLLIEQRHHSNTKGDILRVDLQGQSIGVLVTDCRQCSKLRLKLWGSNFHAIIDDQIG